MITYASCVDHISQFQLSALLEGLQYESGRLNSIHDDEVRHTLVLLRRDRW